MPTLNDLYAMAQNEGVNIISFGLPESKAVSLFEDGKYYIGIDNSKNHSTADEKTLLAHELGHCQTGAFYNEHSPHSLRCKCEKKADEWAILTCIPYDELIKAFESGIYLQDELAEHFGVSEKFLKKAIDYYIEKEQNDASFRENNKSRNNF